MISEHSVISLAEHLSVAELSGEAIVLNARSGKYFGVNEIGAAVFRQLDRPKSVSAITEALGSEYDVAEEDLQKDLLDFLQQLVQNQLIRLQ